MVRVRVPDRTTCAGGIGGRQGGHGHCAPKAGGGEGRRGTADLAVRDDGGGAFAGLVSESNVGGTGVDYSTKGRAGSPGICGGEAGDWISAVNNVRFKGTARRNVRS